MVQAFPVLFALLALHSSVAALSPAAPPVPAPSAATTKAQGISLPLYRNVRGALARRSSSSVLRDWALREKGRITTKYGTTEDGDAATENAGGPVVRRQESPSSAASATRSAFSTAGVSTAPLAGGTATGTLSANASRPTMRTPVGMVPVQNFDADLEYFASVAVGVPAQSMNVILDTGSADLWIASSRCTGFTGCYEVPTINITRSRTAVDINTSFSVRYGSGSASGDIWQDYVSFGGFNVSGQGFALCDVVSPGLLSANISGLMGLGFQTLAASGVTPFWQNLFQAGVFPQFPGFAFYLTRFSNITSAATVEPGGELTLGYLNQTVFEGPINYMPIPDGMASYWLIEMQGLAVNGTNVTALGTPNVAIDTGTTLIGGPAAMIQALYRLVPGALPATGDYQGYYSYPCNASVNVSLTFGGISYNITADDFNLGPFGTTNNISTCLGAFFDLSLPSSSRITWVIGAAFLKNVYSVFRANPPSVGFARLSPFSFNSTYNISNPFNNGTFPNTTFQNGSNIPNGFFGPSGATSLRSTPTPMSVTTAIQAGQSSMAAPASARARRNFELGGRGEWGGIAMALLLTLGFVAIGGMVP